MASNTAHGLLVPRAQITKLRQELIKQAWLSDEVPNILSLSPTHVVGSVRSFVERTVAAGAGNAQYGGVLELYKFVRLNESARAVWESLHNGDTDPRFQSQVQSMSQLLNDMPNVDFVTDFPLLTKDGVSYQDKFQSPIPLHPAISTILAPPGLYEYVWDSESKEFTRTPQREFVGDKRQVSDSSLGDHSEIGNKAVKMSSGDACTQKSESKQSNDPKRAPLCMWEEIHFLPGHGPPIPDGSTSQSLHVKAHYSSYRGFSTVAPWRKSLIKTGQSFLLPPKMTVQDILNAPSFDADMKFSSISQQHSSSEMRETWKFIELFAGIGGFRVGIENVPDTSDSHGTNVSYSCVLACEISKAARNTYLANFPNTFLHPSLTHSGKIAPHSQVNHQQPPHILHGDVRCLREDSIQPYDLLTAGFPCQPFSRLGTQPGFLDAEKGLLFLQIIRILSKTRPPSLLLENVPGLIKLEMGASLAAILRALSRLGYCVGYQVIDAGTLLPQTRRRIYIVGIRSDLLKSVGANHTPFFAFPLFPHLRRTIEHVVQGSKLSKLHLLSMSKWRSIQQSRSFKERPYWRLAHRKAPAGTLVASYKRGYLYSSQLVVVAPSEISQALSVWSDSEANVKEGHLCSATQRSEEAVNLCERAYEVGKSRSGLVADGENIYESFEEVLEQNSGDLNHFEDESKEDSKEEPDTHELAPVRFFTERECARLMGFPESFILPGSGPILDSAVVSYSQLGNAVCPPIVGAIGRVIERYVSHLREHSDKHDNRENSIKCDLSTPAFPVSWDQSSGQITGAAQWLKIALYQILQSVSEEEKHVLLHSPVRWTSERDDFFSQK